MLFRSPRAWPEALHPETAREFNDESLPQRPLLGALRRVPEGPRCVPWPVIRKRAERSNPMYYLLHIDIANVNVCGMRIIEMNANDASIGALSIAGGITLLARYHA